MAISIIPNSEVITVGNQFYLRPNPSTTPPLGNKNPRSGLLPWLYETINPSLTITVTTDGVCYGLVPDIILSADYINKGVGVIDNTASTNGST